MRLKTLAAAALLLVIATGADITTVRGQTDLSYEQNNASNIVFVHTGGQPSGSESVVSVLKALLNKGYSLRKPDTASDQVKGPGVDYFSDEDLPAAQDIAKTVNDSRPPGSPRLEARRLIIANPPHYFGVWL